MDSWERFDETLIPNIKSKRYFTDEDYIHAQKVFEGLKIKNLGYYHDLYVQSDTLLLVMYLKIFEVY